MASKRNYIEKTNQLLVELPEFVSEYIYSRGPDTSPSTRFSYTYDINHFLRWILLNHPAFCETSMERLTVTDLNKITVVDINQYLTTFMQEHGQNTTARKRASLSSFFDYFYSTTRTIQANPVAGSSRVKRTEKELIYLTDEEQQTLLHEIMHGPHLTQKQMESHEKLQLRDYAMILLFLDTGLRVSEVQQTQVKDFDFQDCSVLVTRKGGKHEIIYYSDETCEALKEYYESKNESDKDLDEPFFMTLQHEAIGVRAIENMVKKYTKAALPQKYSVISPHKLRSSFAMSFYRESGYNLSLLQKRMSHKNISTTNIYNKATQKEVEESRNWRQNLGE